MSLLEIPAGSRDTQVACDDGAYLLLEEARLRCEALEDEAETSASRHGLAALHRELGLAGFFAGSELPPWTRHELLALAHDRSRMVMTDAGEALLGLFVTTVAAERALEARLIAPGGGDHIHLAHVHLLAGEDLLAQILIPVPSAPGGLD